MNAPATTETKTILLDGATGYIGSHLACALSRLAQFKQIKCLVRKNAKEEDIHSLKVFAGDIIQADLIDDTANNAFANVDVACHLIGSIAPRKGETSASLHIGQTERFIKLCLNSKVKKIVMVSACGSNAKANSEYHRTKWQAERIVIESGIPAIILRPSLVIGKTTGQRNSKLVSRLEYLIRNKSRVPLIAGGINKIQPLFIDDLTQAIINSIEDPNILSKKEPILELGGSEILTLKKFVQRMMTKIGIQKPLLNLPPYIATLIAAFAEPLQEVPVISFDQIKLAQQDNICANNQLPLLLKRPPLSIEASLDSYQWHKEQ